MEIEPLPIHLLQQVRFHLTTKFKSIIQKYRWCRFWTCMGSLNEKNSRVFTCRYRVFSISQIPKPTQNVRDVIEHIKYSVVFPSFPPQQLLARRLNRLGGLAQPLINQHQPVHRLARHGRDRRSLRTSVHASVAAPKRAARRNRHTRRSTARVFAHATRPAHRPRAAV